MLDLKKKYYVSAGSNLKSTLMGWANENTMKLIGEDVSLPNCARAYQLDVQYNENLSIAVKLLGSGRPFPKRQKKNRWHPPRESVERRHSHNLPRNPGSLKRTSMKMFLNHFICRKGDPRVAFCIFIYILSPLPYHTANGKTVSAVIVILRADSRLVRTQVVTVGSRASSSRPPVARRDACVDAAIRAIVVARTEKVEKTKHQPTPVGNYLYATIP